LPTVYDVPADAIIQRLATYIKDNTPEVSPPPWSPFVKTGSHAERPPQNPDWWYIRCASLLRKIYFKGPVGVSRLRSEYGGRARRGNAPEHTREGGGSIIRNALQQLERAGYVRTIEREGREITAEGRSLLDSLANQLVKKEKKSTRSRRRRKG
jgi:small subunit ribosomal protein S19e